MPGEISVKLRVVTPLFMGGADPRGHAPELRSQSVRGALRWWLRALLGGTGWAGSSFSDTGRLWQEEAKVFGSADAQFGGASPVKLTLTDMTSARDIRTVTKEGRDRRQIVGRDYLLYGMHQQGDLQARQYFQPGSGFEVNLSPRLNTEHSQDVVERAAAAFWLLTMLGGLGARSRRGAGCLDPTSTDWLATLPALTAAQTPAELQSKLQSGIKDLRKRFAAPGYSDGPGGGKINPPASPFTVLHPDYLTIHVLARTWDKWETAMDDVGRTFATFRRDEVKSDSQAVAAFIQNNTAPQQIKRAAFGLPLPFYFATIGNAKAGISGNRHERSASPLTFHFSQLQNGKIALVVVASYRDLLGGDQLKVSSGRQRVNLAPPSVDIFGDLVDDLNGYIAEDMNSQFLQVAYRQEGQQ